MCQSHKSPPLYVATNKFKRKKNVKRIIWFMVLTCFWMGDKFHSINKVESLIRLQIPIVFSVSCPQNVTCTTQINPISSGFIPVFNQMRCTPFSVLFNVFVVFICVDSSVPINVVHLFSDTSYLKCRMQFNNLMKTKSYSTLCKLKFEEKGGKSFRSV